MNLLTTHNKRGDFTGILYLIVMIAAFAIFLLILGYVVPQIYNPLKQQIGTTAEINQSLDAGINVSQNTFPVIWFIMFAGLVIGLMITAWFIPSHPIFFPIFAILMVIAIIVGMALSNAYESLSAEATLSGAATEQSSIGFVMLNLPYVAFIIGILTLIISFAKPGGQDVSPG